MIERKHTDDGWKQMKEAPQDGTAILALNEDGSTDRVYWSTERYCLLGRRAGSFPDGWVSEEINLPVDPPIAWKPI